VREISAVAAHFWRKHRALQGAYGELLRQYAERGDALQDALYCMRQYKTLLDRAEARIADLEGKEGERVVQWW
jgi:hypothetical protein